MRLPGPLLNPKHSENRSSLREIHVKDICWCRTTVTFAWLSKLRHVKCAPVLWLVSPVVQCWSSDSNHTESLLTSVYITPLDLLASVIYLHKQFSTFTGARLWFYCCPNPDCLCFSPTTRVKIPVRITYCLYTDMLYTIVLFFWLIAVC